MSAKVDHVLLNNLDKAFEALYRRPTWQQIVDDPDLNWAEQRRVAERIQDDAVDGKIHPGDVAKLAELVMSLRDAVRCGGKKPDAWGDK